MNMPGIPELIIILAVALLIFGPKKLPEMGKAIGSSITEFRKGMAGKHEDPAKTDPKQIPESKPPENV